MKPLMQSVLFVCCIALVASCNKQSTGNCIYTHARILRYDCEIVVLQILDNSIQGDAQWTDIMTGNTYTNVVSYNHTCVVATATSNALGEIYLEGAFVTATPREDGNCIKCMAVSPNPPQTKIDIAGLSLTGCNDGN